MTLGSSMTSSGREWKSPLERRGGVDSLRGLLATMHLQTEPSPIFDFFHWHRVVVDEGHEFVSDYAFLNSIAAIDSSYRWYVTGTPFPNTNAVQGIIQFLQFEETKPKNAFKYLYAQPDPYDFQRWHSYTRLVLANILYSNFYMRNTKLSIKEEFQIPNCIEELLLIDLHPVEAALYAVAEMKENTGFISLPHTSLDIAS